MIPMNGICAHPNDSPVSSHRPLDGLAVAVTRRNAKGGPVAGDEVSGASVDETWVNGT